MPASRLARIAWYLLGLDLFLFLLQKLFAWWNLSFGQSLGGWVIFLSLIVILLFTILAYRWLKQRLLWRLRNRLIVTYVFIGVTPVVLLIVLASGTFYLFAGQFATFVVTSGIDSQLSSLVAVNSAVTHEIAGRLGSGGKAEIPVAKSLRQNDEDWSDREVYAWLNGKPLLASVPGNPEGASLTLPSHVGSTFRQVVRDRNKLSLRALQTTIVKGETLTVLSSEPLDRHFLDGLSANLGEVTLYGLGLTLSKVNSQSAASRNSGSLTLRKEGRDYVLDTGRSPLVPTFTVGSVPPAVNWADRQVSFATTVSTMNWESGDTSQPIAISVQTRVSKLYERLFGSLGDFAPAIEFVLLVVAVVFALIELFALIIGTRLTRTVTGAVAQLYDATRHINRGDFSHRIPVKSDDQLAALANSFNSMTASLEKLIQEQKEKQRMENELAIAQEVQSQLFPKQTPEHGSLEVHGFCRPARTVSGDYYDFLEVTSEKLLLAVGDVSGKGISAALLMATIHSAVRAYSVEGVPFLSEPIAVGASPGSAKALTGINGAETSPGLLLSLLNHQLFESTPTEKYATLFLGTYDATRHRLTYSNGGHLPPIIVGDDGHIRRLECGGTVVGLFDNMSYDESSVPLRPGEIFVGYSDGVTEPENDFGEFGEERLIDLVRENRHLPLPRIREAVTAALDDWIGDREQPDDVTLVFARAR